ELLRTPNNVLGLEYIKALRRLGSSIRPFTVPRLGAEHDDLRPFGDIASAAYLRTLIRENHLVNALPFMPPVCRQAVSAAVGAGLCPASEEKLESAILYRLRQMSAEDFAALPAMSEGLQNRLLTAAQKAGSVEEFLSLCKTKRYPLTRLQRALWCAFLGITAADADGAPPYLRPLGVTDRGMEVLRAAKANGCTLPLFSRVSQAELLSESGQRVWQLECRAADLYALALPTPPPCGGEHTTALFKYQP
ncbi:MAG: nucleotidyltransferase family protein, partial [Clostridia bacterium]|nr:nucleotidyltransferase family protein [Clostridia bacterium]